MNISCRKVTSKFIHGQLHHIHSTLLPLPMHYIPKTRFLNYPDKRSNFHLFIQTNPISLYQEAPHKSFALMKMPSNLLQESLLSSGGAIKPKSDKITFVRQLKRWLTSSTTLFVWALFLIALTSSYLHFIDRNQRNGRENQRGSEWETQVRTSCTPRSRKGNLQVLVTGAAGFVGAHVTLALKKRGDGVLGLDNFNGYYDPTLKRARQALLKSRGVFIVEGDINDRDLLLRLFDLVSFSHVMHLAAQAGVRYALENPMSYVHSNIAGLVNMFEVCKAANPQPAVVWASSSSVYGLNEKTPFSESDRTDRPASLYAATKKAGEEIAHTYNHIYGLAITGLRFFTVYGPWGRPDMAYFSFTRNILQGKPVTVYRQKVKSASPELARDFTYIDDIVKGCVAALDTAGNSTGSGGKKTGPAKLRVYNLGNTRPVSVTSMVSLLEGLLKVKAKKKFVHMPGNGDVAFTHANITLARAELAYNPTTDLHTGLKKFVKWYQSYYGYHKI